MESWITLKMWFAFLVIGSVFGDADDMARSEYIARVERGGRILIIGSWESEG